jgi:hypothetical protein
MAETPLCPSVALLVKLGSIAVHAEEFMSADRHEFDLIAMEQLLKDPEVVEWRALMDQMAMLPKKRKP